MSVDNVVFPSLPLLHGVRRQSVFPTQVVTSNGFQEYRLNRSGDFDRYTWTYPTSTLFHDAEESCQASNTTINALYQFWIERNGGLNGFKFVDPNYPEFVDAILQLDSGSDYFLRLPFNDSTPGLHRVWNFNIPDYTVNTGSITAAFIDTDGEPKITVSGAVGDVRISGPCYMTARFDSNIESVMLALNVDNTPYLDSYAPITLRELFETADL